MFAQKLDVSELREAELYLGNMLVPPEDTVIPLGGFIMKLAFGLGT